MSNKKMIPCRVCGKPFEPCAYCQSHTDVFRWRNFACSMSCATKYINDTIEYRKSMKNKDNKTVEKIKVTEKSDNNISVGKFTSTKKRISKKTE